MARRYTAGPLRGNGRNNIRGVDITSFIRVAPGVEKAMFSIKGTKYDTYGDKVSDSSTTLEELIGKENQNIMTKQYITPYSRKFYLSTGVLVDEQQLFDYNQATGRLY